MKSKFILIAMILITNFSFGQEESNNYKKHIFGFSFGAGVHLPTDLNSNITRGDNSLTRSEIPKVLSLAFLYKAQLYKGIYLRTGLNFSMHYDLSNYEINYPSELPQTDNIHYGKHKGLDHHISKLSLPIQLEWQIPMSKNWKFQLYGGVHLSTYLINNTSYLRESYVWLDDSKSSFVTLYDIDTDYLNVEQGIISFGTISDIKLEGALGMELAKTFNFGGIAIGIEYYQGTKKLSESSYEILPDDWDYTTSGSFKLNRSYFSFNTTYTFK